MSTYSTGNETKKRIEKAARELFYKHGFNNTTYAQVSKLAQVNLGTIVYHYRSLDNLADIIYKEIVNERKDVYENTVNAIFGSSKFKKSTVTFAQYWVNTHSYLTYPNYSKFISERMLQSSTWNSPAFDYSMYDICRDYKLNISMNEYVLQKYLFLPYAAIASSAANKGDIDLNANEICEYQSRIRLHSYGMKEEDIDQIITDSKLISSKVTLKINDYMEFI